VGNEEVRVSGGTEQMSRLIPISNVKEFNPGRTKEEMGGGEAKVRVDDEQTIPQAVYVTND